MFIATVVNSLIDKFRGGSKDAIIAKSKALDNEYQSKNAFAPGLEINPGAGERLVVTKIIGNDSYLINIAGLSDNVGPDTLPGERRLFSVDGAGDLSTYLKLKNNGKLELNGNDNFAVLYSELKLEFNKLNSAFNELVTKYNGHTHPYINVATPAVTSPTTATGAQSSADITLAKSVDVLLPSNA